MHVTRPLPPYSGQTVVKELGMGVAAYSADILLLPDRDSGELVFWKPLPNMLLIV